MKTFAALALCLTAGAYGQTCSFPGGTVIVPPTPNAATAQGIALNGVARQRNIGPFEFDITPSLTQLTKPETEYCPPGTSGYSFLMTRIIPNTSTVLGVYTNHGAHEWSYQALDVSSGAVSVLSTVTIGQVNQQLAARGLQQALDFDHEVLQLPSGSITVISHEEELVPCSQYPTECWTGYTQPQVDIMGDQVIVLDSNGNLQWAWNPFSCPNCAQDLPIGIRAVLGEKCIQAAPEYCAIQLAPVADDWLHMNSIAYDPADGNLVVSIRHQDAIIKIAYQNGSGDGHIVWRLGYKGGFKMINSLGIPSPWFSHQHDVEILSDNPLTLSLFDNGNTRRSKDAAALSRVQILTVDETKHTVDIASNYDLPVYSSAYGNVQLLTNGNWWVLAGDIANPSGGAYSQGYELTPAGEVVYKMQFGRSEYRSWRFTGISPFVPAPY